MPIVQHDPAGQGQGGGRSETLQCRVSARNARPVGGLATMTQGWIGVDVSKDWIDVFDPRADRHARYSTSPASLARFAGAARGAQVIFEGEAEDGSVRWTDPPPNGGYDRPLAEALQRAGVAFTRVNPRQAREFARGPQARATGSSAPKDGKLAKTDRVDAELLARMGAALTPEATPPVSPARQRLAELLSRRQDLVGMIGQERNRARQARDPWIRTAIATHLQALRRQLAAIGQRIAQHVAAEPDLAEQAQRLRGPHPASARIPQASCSRSCPNWAGWTGAASPPSQGSPHRPMTAADEPASAGSGADGRSCAAPCSLQPSPPRATIPPSRPSAPGWRAQGKPRKLPSSPSRANSLPFSTP